jgi:hypothetical protein
LLLAGNAASAAPKEGAPAAPVAYAELAVDPAHGLAGSESIKSASSRIVPAAAPNAAYCQVDVVYGTAPDQNITIRVGLPLNSKDGGRGGVEGAWNGRTEGIGGGGCSGNLDVRAPVNAGYVGSGSDAGHSGGDCEPGVNADPSLSQEAPPRSFGRVRPRSL